jgi:PAS domain S-box-containing protein
MAGQLLRSSGSELSAIPQNRVKSLRHELQVHQIELEVQNEELRQAQVDLADSLDKYVDLYEFAPIGYVTLDAAGRITGCNLAASATLGMDRINLIGKAISSFVTRDSTDQCHFHLRAVFGTDTKQVCELQMRKQGRTPLIVRLESILQRSSVSQTRSCRTALIDVTEARTAQRKLQELNENLEQQVKVRTSDLQAMASELMLTEERERRRLAEDLHDSLGQAVFRARMLLDRGAVSDQTVVEIRTILEEISRTVNTLTHELSPLVLRQMGLWAALEWLIGNLKERYDLQVRLKGNERDVELDEKMGLVLFRSVREILINVAKHAQTDFASVLLRPSNNFLEVSIRDNGKGFNLLDQARQVPSGHFGLFSISERMKYIGGSFNIRSRPGAGTTVTLRVPAR